MTFAAPWLLLLGLLAALPCYAHMRRRARLREVPFAALEIARAVAPRRQRVQPPEDRALLALRVLAVLVVALAAAAPTCVRPSVVARADGLAVILDDSASMRAADPAGGTRFDRARRAALRALDDGTSPRVVAALAHAPVQVAVGRGATRAALAAARPTSAAGDLSAAARAALRELAGRGARHPALVVVTDAVATSTPGGPDALGALAGAAGAALVFPLGPAPLTANAGVVEARYVLDEAVPRVEATLGCYGPHRAGYHARLLAGTRVLSEAEVTCRHDALTAFSLPLAVIPEGSDAEVVIDARDALPADDRRAVALRPGSRPVVTVASPSPTAGGAALAAALRATGAFTVRELPPLALAAAPPADVLALVAVTDADLPPDAAATIRAAPPPLLVVGEAPAALVAAGALPVLAVTLRVDRATADPPVLGASGVPVPDAIGLDVRGLLPVTATRWWALVPRPGARTLWTMAGAAVLVASGSSEPPDARALVLGVPLDERASDLALRPAWVALAAGAVTWLAAPRTAADMRATALTRMLRAPAGARITGVAGPDGAALTVRATPDGVEATGTYDPGLYRVTTTRAEVPALAFAVGIDPAESDLRPGVLPRAALTAPRTTSRTPLRAHLAVAALALLALETWWRTRRARRARRP